MPVAVPHNIEHMLQLVIAQANRVARTEVVSRLEAWHRVTHRAVALTTGVVHRQA
jgi:hypothetical protein